MSRQATVTAVVRAVGRYLAVLTWPSGETRVRGCDTLREARRLQSSRQGWGVRVDLFRLRADRLPRRRRRA